MLLTSEMVAVLGSEECSAVSLVSSPRDQQPSTPETNQTVSRCCRMAPGGWVIFETHHVDIVA